MLTHDVHAYSDKKMPCAQRNSPGGNTEGRVCCLRLPYVFGLSVCACVCACVRAEGGQNYGRRRQAGQRMPASCRRPVLHCTRPFPLPHHCCRVGRQDPNAGNSRVAECRSQTVREHDFWHSRSSQEHADRLARCDLLLVFYSGRTQTITSRLCSPIIPQEDTSSSAFDRRNDSATAEGLYVINAWSVLRESICSSVSISRYFVDVGTLRAIVSGTVRLASVVKVENPRRGNSIFSVGSHSHEGRQGPSDADASEYSIP